MLTSEIKQLRLRFISDMNLPIQVIHSPYFENMLELLEDEYQAKTKYINLCEHIDNTYHGNIHEFLTDFYSIRDNIINTILNNPAYQKFNNDNIDNIINKMGLNTSTNIHKLQKREIYIPDNNGSTFISIDLKHANFTALRAANNDIVNGYETYEGFIKSFINNKIDPDYIINSKYTRQVIFGKLNPKRTITIENYIMNKVYNVLIETTNILDIADLYSVKSDELIFKVHDLNTPLTGIEYGDIKFISKYIPLHITKYILKHYEFGFASSDAKLHVYKQKIYNNSNTIIKEKLKCVPSTYMPQVYKLINKKEITDNDLVFYYEHQLTKFLYPIKLVNK